LDVATLLTQKSWSPYVVGAAIGVLSWFAFWSADQPLGITTAFESTAAQVQQAVSPSAEGPSAYIAQKRSEGKPPKIGWEVMLVIGVFCGALISSLLSGDREQQTVPQLWSRRFGGSVAFRLIIAFMAGGLMMFGARLAQGCTSGHGISGTLQLAVSSWLFISIAFGVGALVVLAIFGRGTSHV
jgi:uncharacterized protein